MKKLIYMTIACALIFGACKKDGKKPSISSGSGSSTASNKVRTVNGDTLLYNSAGLLSKRKGSNNYTQSYVWSMGLLTVTDSSNAVLVGTTAYTRNSAGYVVSVSFSGNSTNYTYDAAGHLTQEQYNSASSTLADVFNYTWSSGNMTSMSYPESASSTITYTFEYLGDKETRDVGLKYFPTLTSNFYSTTNKNLIKSVKRSDLNYTSAKYTYQKDINGRVIQQTVTEYYMNWNSLDSTMYTTNYTYY